jgi:transcriptional regulator GlxA family with amidase domain
MTINDYILPMTTTKRIIFLTYTDAELLDMSGPMCVFSAAARLNQAIDYQCIVVSTDGGLIRHSCGTNVDTLAAGTVQYRATDTVLVVGAGLDVINRVSDNASLTASLQRAAVEVNRFGSICTGSFLLGNAGLLKSKAVATHWAAQREFAKNYSEALIDQDSLYVQDGQLWTSAGVTTGIDMALAMVEQDLGSAIKSQIAKLLVVYSHRPGNQSQFSDVLAAQSRVDNHFHGLVNWLMKRIDRPPKVDEMADYVNMSPRSFARKFKSVVGSPPSKFLERMRLNRARQLLEAGQAIKSVANNVGFASQAAFRSAFKSAYGVTPLHYSKMSKS